MIQTAHFTPRPLTEDNGAPLHFMRSIALFANLADSEVRLFQEAVRMHAYKKSRIIFHQTDLAKYFYVVCSGWIKLFRTMPDGQEVIVDMLTTASTFGENAIFEEECHVYSAMVIEDVVLLSIPSYFLRERIRLNTDLAFNMLSTMSKHHRHHYSALAFNAMLSAPQRIGCFLLRQCPRDSKGCAAFDLPYDKTLIANTLGMKGATFSRALNILKQKGCAKIKDTHVEISSIQKLAEFVYGADSGKYIADDT